MERDESTQPSGGERWLVAALVAVAVALRVVLAARFRIDSDEPQHLHVVWAWTQGLLPYRDVFDNHMPLFQLLCSPLLRMIGERPDAVVYMRLAMLPTFGIVLWAMHRIGRVVFSPRDALWAVALCGLGSVFFLCSLEFRTDDLWMVCWFLALAVAVEGRVTPRRSALVGLLLGLAVAVSLKTTLMLVAVAGAGAATWLLAGRGGPTRPSFWRNTGAALGGVAIAPMAVTAVFLLEGAFGPYLYGAVWHNLVPGLGQWGRAPAAWRAFPLLVGGALAAAVVVWRTGHDAHVALRRVFVLLAGGIYAVGLFTLWPLRTRQDLLPIEPLAILMLVPLVRGAGDRLGRALGAPRWIVPALATTLALVSLVATARPWRDDARAERTFVTNVLRLTRPGETVFDLKGDAIFRARPYYYAIENLTKVRLARGLLPDDIATRLVESGTDVTVADVRDLPPATRAFVRSHYVLVGDVRVSGALLAARPSAPPATFDIAVPALYAVVGERAPVEGLLDGSPYVGPRFLAPGPHEFLPTDDDGRVAVVWSRAIDLGYSPFGGRGLHG